jgi:putative two-component system response regulator
MTLQYDDAIEETSLVTTLIVDDDDSVRGTLQRYLVSLGHEVVVVGSGAEATAEIRRRKVTCILLDVRLPDTSGLDLVPALLEHEPNAAILMLTAVNDANSAALCMQRGAMDYLVKPVDLADLQRAITRALARRRDLLEQAQTQAWLKQEIVQRGAELRRERGNLERVSVATLEALVNALEAKDPFLRGHSARIADLSAAVAAEMGLNDEQVELVRTAGRLHDIGKIGIRETVLSKRGPLTDDEFDHVKTHVLIGAQILAPLTHLREVIAYVRSHHERADGTGYPDGLAGNAIPLGARILGAAEVYDALTTARPYQEKMTPSEAVSRMRDLVGTVIDPAVHAGLDAVVNRRGALVFIDERVAEK